MKLLHKSLFAIIATIAWQNPALAAGCLESNVTGTHYTGQFVEAATLANLKSATESPFNISPSAGLTLAAEDQLLEAKPFDIAIPGKAVSDGIKPKVLKLSSPTSDTWIELALPGKATSDGISPKTIMASFVQ